MWLLTIEDDEGTTSYHRLSREQCAVGRSPDNDVVLSQLDVSRRHARLERGEGAWVVVDEASDNGTFVNGRAIGEPTRLGLDDVLQIGGYRLSFSEGDHANAPTPAPRYVPPARLRVLAGPAAGTEHVFARDEIVTLGRSDDCSVRLLHANIVGVHAMVQPLPGGRYEVVDTSGYGVYVNGRALVRKVLEGGDAINIGGVALLRYLEPRQAFDPRFDGVAPGGVLPPLGAPEAEASPRGDAVAVAADGRFEAVGPRAVPSAGPEPASFRAARDEGVRVGALPAPGALAGAAGAGVVAGAGADAARPWWPLADVEGPDSGGSPATGPSAAPAKTGAAPAPKGSPWSGPAGRRERARLVTLSLLAMALGLASAALLTRHEAGETLAAKPEGVDVDVGVAAATGRSSPAASAFGATAASALDATAEARAIERPDGAAAAGPVDAPAAAPSGASARAPNRPPTSVRGGDVAWSRKQHCWKQEGGPCAEQR